jgi:3-hydroxy-9,10-secoandrosta-1,3,5(10)-triene-9,17-dione monooxygenase
MVKNPVAPVSTVEYLDRIRALLPAIRERAVATEQLGRISDETMTELGEAGVLAALQPRRWGGLEVDPATYFQGAVLLGSACASTGWVATVLGMHPWELACMHPEAQTDVWGDDPTTLISSSYAPTGSARRDGDGFHVSGRWGFSSGVDHCDFALLGALVAGEEKRGPRVFLINKEDFTIDQESWDVAGLSGTGSKDVNVDGVHVPPYRTHTMAEINDPSWIRPGLAANDGPLYRLAFADLFAWGIAGPALGAATGFANIWLDQSRSRVPAFGGPGVADKVELQLRLAEGLAGLNVLNRSMISTWQEIYDAVADGGEPDPSVQMQGRYMGARTIADSLDAVMIMFANAGGGVMNKSNPLQRFLRDLLAMRNHPVASLERYAGDQARHELTATS